MGRSNLVAILAGTTLLVLLATPAQPRNSLRNDFFDVYPAAEGSRLDDLAIWSTALTAEQVRLVHEQGQSAPGKNALAVQRLWGD